ncbi:MAG: hypothetical protein U0U46_06765 [Saprospiraceae bacterium]
MNRFTLSLLFLLAITELLPAQIMSWVSACSDKTFCINPGGCSQGNVLMFEQAVTNCIFSSDVDYSYKIDLNNNGGIELNSPNDTCTGPFPVGTHKIYWRASDNCGNVINCTYLFTIKDCTPPSLLCINGLTQSIELPDCETTFTPDQFILSVSDNCTPVNQLEYGIREAGTGTGFPNADSLTFNECDLGLNFVEIWVRDGNGLMNLCQNYVLVQQNGMPCNCNPDGEITLNGCVRSAGNKKLNGYTIKSTVQSLAGVQPPVLKNKVQNFADSCFSLQTTQLPFGGQYRATLSANRYGDPKEGVSTFDLVLMSKHILGVDPFTSIYQWLASDVNKSNSVTTFDIVETRKLLLGIYDTFPASPSWRLIRPVINPADFAALATVKDTYQIQLPSLNDDIGFQNLNFLGIKTGDANMSATFTNDEPEDRSPLWVQVADRWLQAGETLTIPVAWGQTSSLEGWQLGFQADPALARIEGAEGLPDDQFHVLPDASLRALWFGPGAVAADRSPVFYLKISALENTRLSEALQLQSDGFRPEAYVPGEGKHSVQLRFAAEGSSEQPGGLQIFGPYPNPANGDSRLELRSDAPSEADLWIFDAAGRTVHRRHLLLSAGMQTIVLPTAELTAGILAWRLVNGQQTYSGRLINE